MEEGQNQELSSVVQYRINEAKITQMWIQPHSSYKVWKRIRWSTSESMFEKSVLLKLLLLSPSEPALDGCSCLKKSDIRKSFIYFGLNQYFSLRCTACFLNFLCQLSGAKRFQWNWNPERQTELQNDVPERELTQSHPKLHLKHP